MNYKWKLNPPTPEKQEAANRLAKELNISPILGLLLIERNITTAAEAKRFFRPSLTELYDPFLLTDMDKAVERLNKALGRKERIMVYGDYDVDGCTAVALVYKFLQQFYSNIDYYIPNRYEEGYGVSVKGIDYAYETGVKLIIVLDCGIKAVDEIAYAQQKGHRLHHLRPPCAGRNPAARSGHPERQAVRLHLPLPSSFRMRSGLQTHAGFCQKQRHRVLPAHPAAGPLCREHRLGHRAHHGRKPHPRLPRPAAAERQPQHRTEGHHRRVRLVGTGTDHQRHHLQDWTAHQCLRTHSERKRGRGAAGGKGLQNGARDGGTNQPLQRNAQGLGQDHDGRGQQHRGEAGPAGRTALHRHLQRGMAQRGHRHRGVAPDGNLLPPVGRPHAHR